MFADYSAAITNAIAKTSSMKARNPPASRCRTAAPAPAAVVAPDDSYSLSIYRRHLLHLFHAEVFLIEIEAVEEGLSEFLNAPYTL